MWLNQTCSWVRVGKLLSNLFPIRKGLKQWNALSPLLVNVALEYAIKRVRVKQEGLKLNGAHQVLVYADDVSVLGWIIRTTDEYTDALRFDNKENGLEVNADKTKYMVMSRVQNGGQSNNIKMDNSSFERVEKLKYLGTTLKNQNSMQDKIKSRLISGNVCYHSVQNLLSPSLLTKYMKFKIYRTLILPCCFVWVWRGANRGLVGKPEGNRPLGRLRARWEDNIKMDLQEVGWSGSE
jgi:hypothetical protein